MNINSKIEKLIFKYNLGNKILYTERVVGGLSHRMYKVRTDRDIYAVKELNGNVMKRKEAYSNFVFSEKVANIAKENGIPAICALNIDNNVIFNIDGSFFQIFEWVEGRVLNPGEITEKHCKKIGSLLARIHNTDFSGIQASNRKNIEISNFDFRRYIPLAEKQNKPYTTLLKENAEFLNILNEKALKALEYAKNNLVISHNDLDSKNVLWKDDKVYIIDWESSGYVNPILELVQVAWYWSGGDIEKVDYKKFEEVIKSYTQIYNGKIDNNFEILINGDIYGGLGWVNYNLKRSLCLDGEYNAEEIRLAEREIMRSIEEIKYNLGQFKKMSIILKKCLL